MSKCSMIGEILGSIAFCVLLVVLVWLYLIATPYQMSGEADLFRAQVEALEK